jgi:hypothetical protein
MKVQKCKVWNKHPHGLTHREKFKDQMIEIKAGEFVTMDYYDGVQFKGQYFPMLRDAQGAPDPKGFKCIQVEALPLDGAPEQEFICHFDGAKFPTKELLEKYLFANYADHTFKDDQLEEQLAAQEKKKPGRPPKDAA